MKKLTHRRKFVTDSLTGAAALVATNTLAVRSSAASPSDKINASIVGVGGMGSGHVKRLLARDDVHLKTIVDVDQSHAERAQQTVYNARGHRPETEEDFRRMLEDKSIDAVVIATPHHWHAPIAIRAMRAGKDVYVEKPASHVFREGRLMMEAAKKYNRIFQHGTQMRSADVTKEAGKVLASGLLGEIKMSKAWNCQKHKHRQTPADTPAPAGVNYDLWLGPASERTFNLSRFHRHWSWFREYSNGDIGNDGAHDLDMARFGLGVETHPNRITAHGSRIHLEGEREYPDNMMVAYHYDEGKVMLYEDRGWTPYGIYGFDSGNAFYGTEGFMVFSRRGYFQTYIGKGAGISVGGAGEAVAFGDKKGPGMRGGNGHPEHMNNFLDCVKSREQPIANAEVAHLSCALSHLGEATYRTSGVTNFNPDTEQFIDNPEADKLLTKEYREPWGLPDPV